VVSVPDVAMPLHRVRIGPIHSVARFDALIGRLTGLGMHDARLVTID